MNAEPLAPGAAPAAEPPLPVAVDASSLVAPLAGIGQYTLNIARAWAAEPRLKPAYFDGACWGARAEVRAPPQPHPLRRFVRDVVPRSYEIARALTQRAFDRRPGGCRVYFEPSFLPYAFPGPTVLTVHDLSHVRYAQTHPAARVRILEKLLPGALARAAHVLTDSHFQRDEITSYYGIAPERVTVAHLGAAAPFRPRRSPECAEVLQRHGLLFRSYVLSVATLEPRKNLGAVLDAYARLPAALRQRFPLVLAGTGGWNTEALAPRLRALAQSGEVRALGYVDAEVLPVLYSAAALFLYPSLYEGFGLPALEAMASRIPVIVSNRASLPEVVGAAGVQLPPEDVPAMTLAMQELLEDRAAWERRALAALERSRAFSWERCAAVTADVLVRAAA